MQIHVLGSARAVRATAEGDEPVDLGARKPRSIVAALALTPGRPVTADLLADLVWAGEPPRAAHGALHAYLSGLRKALEPDRPTRGAGSVIETTDHGYVLRVDPEDVDAHAFAAEVRAAGPVLAPLASQLTAGGTTGWPSRAEVTATLDRLDAALDRWRGEPYADLPDHPDVLAERAALEQLRASAEESRLLGLLALGEHASVLSATETATGRHQLRERLWALHALALVRAGRQADALEALRTVRGVLADELGLDPGAELRALEDAVLQQAPGLLATLPRPVEPSLRSVEPSLWSGPAPTVGRDDERAVLRSVLDRARGGSFAAAVVVGEPGLGKTRLTDELVEAASAAGVRVGVGRCSQDDGAPPLWPWRAVLEGLGLDADATAPADEGLGAEQRAFLSAERLAGAVLGVAAEVPVLVVLDDLHWSDEASLRALAHLLGTTPPDVALAVVVTRRPHPVPTGQLAHVGEVLARRHAERLDLTGLEPDGSAALLRSLAEGTVADETVRAWHERAGGNPFFLIELARLGAGAGAVPGTVRDVLTRRVDGLGDDAADTLRTAAVVGRHFLLATVAAASGADPDLVADHLDAAVAAGLVRETGPEQYAFAHALTRDAVDAALSETRRARRHAQVAHALEHDPAVRGQLAAEELTAELARHWLAAGPSHTGKAWRAARAAADQARGLAAYAEAVRLRSAAVEAHRRSPETDERERYDLLLELATDAAYAARWPVVEAASAEAAALGRHLGSPELVGRAARAISLYAVWLPHDVDWVDEDLIDDLRWAMTHCDDGDRATRCRLLLALAVELYYVEGSTAERRALVDNGLALARQVGDPVLLWWAVRAAWLACWSPGQTRDRAAWVEEGLTAARAAGDEAAVAVLQVSRAVDALELGHREAWEESSRAAEEIAERLRLPYVQITLHWLGMTMAGIRDDLDEVRRRHALLAETAPRAAIPQQDLQAAAASTLAWLWQPDLLRPVVDQLVAAHEEHGGGAPTLHAMFARCGMGAELVASMARYPLPYEQDEYWSTLNDWAWEGEGASFVGDRSVASHARDVLAPYSGRIVVVGAVATIGPVDGYLALVEATLGDHEAAVAHLEAAEQLAAEWGMTAYVAWLGRERARLGLAH
ncbi:BTAD domain-containing putative transcriptional regulator [Nocardioides taihuensis]|uniref:BTAD domain-containing putative transcriptional regulator n=1 Tax=Nocardioides taihuensis TaxID=1835606 RepID=A0ABW0BHM6_9ACTN